MRRIAPTGLIAAAALVGCGNPGPTPGGEPNASQRQARIELIRANAQLTDLELAHLCPALYPKDVLKDPKKYRFEKQKVKATFSPEQLALAAKARCGKPAPANHGTGASTNG